MRSAEGPLAMNLINWQIQRLPAFGRRGDRIPDSVRLERRLADEGF